MEELEEGEIGEEVLEDRRSLNARTRRRTKNKTFEYATNMFCSRKQQLLDMRRQPRHRGADFFKTSPVFRKPADLNNRISAFSRRLQHAATPSNRPYPLDNSFQSTFRNKNTNNRNDYPGSMPGQWQRQRRSSIAQQTPRQDATYEDLLRQHREIKMELDNIAKEEERHDKENRKSISQKKRRRRTQSLSKKVKNQPVIIQEEEEEKELRRQALASLTKKEAKSKANESSPTDRREEEWNAVADKLLEDNLLEVKETGADCTDNYEAIDMELDSDGAATVHEDEEQMLREQLIMSLQLKKKQQQQPIQQISATIVENAVHQRPTPKANDKLVINLAEDTSDEDSEPEEGNSEAIMNAPAGLDQFLKMTRLKAEQLQQQKAKKEEESKNGGTPLAVMSLSRAQQAEYRKLKEEIAKRECGQKKTSQSGVQLANCEEKLRRERAALMSERQRLNTLHLQALGKRKEVREQQLRLKKIKEQEAAVQKMLATGLTGLRKLSAQMQGVQSLVEKRVDQVRTLGRECVRLGRLARGPGYKIPTLQKKRRTSTSVLVAVKRSKTERLAAEKERLQQLQREVALRIQQLTNSSQPSSKKKKKDALHLVPHHESPPDPTTTVPLQFHWIVPQRDATKTYDWDPIGGEVAKGLKRKLATGELATYTSCLLHLHSYRLNPSYVKKEGRLLSSTSHANLVDPGRQICRFDLLGMCNDDQCQWQHSSRYQSTATDVLVDLAAYSPKLQSSSPDDKYKFSRDLLSKRSRDNIETICLDLVETFRQESGLVAPYFTRLEKRLWRPLGERKHPVEPEDGSKGRPKVHKHLLLPEDFDPDAAASEGEDFRYFSTALSTRLSNLESSVASNPTDTQLWLKLANCHLHSGPSDNSLDRSVDVLSRALESNRSSPELWLQYLRLYGKRFDNKDVATMFQQALEFCPTYQLWWQYLQVTEGYSPKLEICRKILVFLLSSLQQHGERCSSGGNRQLTEVFLYAVQLSVQSGRHDSSLRFFKNLLEGSTEYDDIVLLDERLRLSALQCLGPRLPLLWLCYIHLLAFQSLPRSLFLQENPGRLLSTDAFLISWPDTGQLPVDSLRDIFQKALESCRAQSLQCLHPLYYNQAGLDLTTSGLDAALAPGLHLLKADPDHPELWIFLATLCIRVGRSDRAQELFDEAVSKLGHVPFLCNAVARFHLERDRKSAALDCLCQGSLQLPRTNTSVSEEQKIADLSLQESYVVANRALLATCEGKEWLQSDNGGSTVLAHQRLQLSLFEMTNGNCVEKVYDTLRSFLPTSGEDPSSAFYTLLDLVCSSLVDPAGFCASFLGLAPGNVQLLERTVRWHLKGGDREVGLNVLRRYLGKKLAVAWLWKVVIEQAVDENDHQEAHKIFQQAVCAMPYSSDLWKQYLNYELSQKHQDHVDAINALCQRFQVNIS